VIEEKEDARRGGRGVWTIDEEEARASACIADTLVKRVGWNEDGRMDTGAVGDSKGLLL